MKAKTKLTKLWSILLALVMVVGMLPTVALAAEPATADFSANPTTALALLNAAKTADAEDSTWDSTTKTLTLNGVNFETTAAIAVILPDDAKIVLNGDNIITSGEATSKDSFGICALGDLTINGDGKLDVTGGTATGNSHGIYATNGLSISGTATVTAKGGAAGYYSYGIGSDTTIDISGGTVYAEGGTATTASYGIYAYNNGLTISGDADVTAKGGTATNDSSYGIYSNGNTEISGGTVNATGGTATNGNSYGIYSGYSGTSTNAISISGSANVTAKGGEATNYSSYGIYAVGGVTISGTVNATGGTATNDRSYGIYAITGLTISGDNTVVTATGGTASRSKGIFVNSNYVTILSGQVEATGGTAGLESYGIDSSKMNIEGGTVTAKGGAAPGGDSYGICADQTLTISDGTTSVTATGGEALSSCGIRVKGNLAITDSTVTATGGQATGASCGIDATNDLSISGIAKVEATGGEATDDSYGIYTKGNITITDGTVTANGGDTSSGYSYGIYTDGSLTISDDADVTANGGKANYNSYGIYANTGLTISGDNTVVTATGGEERARKSKGIFVNSNYVTIESGKVEATGGKAGVESYGIEARDNIEISGGTVTATGGEITSGGYTYSFGIYSNNNVTISNTATVTAKGGKTPNSEDTYSYGIHASNGLSISGGTVTAEAGAAPIARALNKAPSISISPNYWWRISESGTYTASSNNGYAWDSAHTYVEIRDTAPAAATTYTVTFDANGGTGEMEAATGVSGEYTLPANGFTAPARKRFKCWSVNGAEKAVGATINVTANTTVTAVWETIPATSTEYDILDGANSSWTQNSNGSLSIRGSGAFSEFVGVKVDGKSVDEQYYTVKEGSTIVTLKAEYLSTLAAGPHTIQLIWKDGTASTTFNINVNNPNTGDNGGLALAAALLALSAAAIATSGFNRKRGKSSR